MLPTGSRASMIARDLVAVDAPLQQVHFLGLAGQDVDHGQAVAVAVLEVLQGLVEHHRGHAAVAVDQRELGFRLLFQRGRGDRQDGVMPEPAAKPTRWMARFFLTTKRPSGGITWRVSPALMALRGPVGEQAAFHRADADLQLALRARRLRGLLIE
jgi:hypothetical protein